jgi:hypothetical protein
VKNERDIEEGLVRTLTATRGIVLATYSAQNIDRLVTMFLPCHRAVKAHLGCRPLLRLDRRGDRQPERSAGWVRQAGAAAVLGMKPSTLRSRMAKLGIARPGKES